jgi:hypothetical protein
MPDYYPLQWLADELRAAGLNVIEEPGWRTRGATSKSTGKLFDPIGQIIHHSADVAREGLADDLDDAGLVNLIVHGRADLPGPLYQIHIDRDGEVHVIAAGRANHAGRGSWEGIPKDSGNMTTVGIDFENNGVGEGWPANQIHVGHVVSAVIARKLGHDAKQIAMHREYSSEGKIDPTGIDGNDWRAKVAGLQTEPTTEEDMPALVSFANPTGAREFLSIDGEGKVRNQWHTKGVPSGWQLLPGTQPFKAVSLDKPEVKDGAVSVVASDVGGVLWVTIRVNGVWKAWVKYYDWIKFAG